MIEQEGKEQNPHRTKYVDNNNKYLDEAIELATELGLDVQEAEIIRTNSTGLVIYNPKNLADRIKGMKNKNQSRADKIKARLLYENNNAESVN